MKEEQLYTCDVCNRTRVMVNGIVGFSVDEGSDGFKRLKQAAVTKFEELHICFVCIETICATNESIKSAMPVNE